MCGRAAAPAIVRFSPSACKFAPFSWVIIANVEYVCKQPTLWLLRARGEQPARLWINTGKWNREAAAHKYLMQSQVNPAHERYLIIKQLLLSCRLRVALWQQTPLSYSSDEGVPPERYKKSRRVVWLRSRAYATCRTALPNKLHTTAIGRRFALMLWNWWSFGERVHWLRALRRFDQFCFDGTR